MFDHTMERALNRARLFIKKRTGTPSGGMDIYQILNWLQAEVQFHEERKVFVLVCNDDQLNAGGNLRNIVGIYVSKGYAEKVLVEHAKKNGYSKDIYEIEKRDIE